MFSTMSSFIGHFHPVFVHLPIGILILACILQLIEKRKPGTDFAQAITTSLLIGMISAVIACITGYFYRTAMIMMNKW
ncbi:DUF2231 domain-containing protein [Paraflavitalea speifideaquila]|uniref:DUF2231 domain-containing protein n=1 Tax=Paraflavitalea speifideaquila TaxID=3076558 RepID=UPI0028EAFBDA|nr:DUF2231 domain-containing protein [Paraflavitalea speifideiaquila]